MLLESLLHQLAALDRNPSGDYTTERDRLIASIAGLCKENPEAATQHLPALEHLLARTEQLRQATLRERLEIQTTLQDLETHLRQLKSFSGPAAADELLLDRLA